MHRSLFSHRSTCAALLLGGAMIAFAPASAGAALLAYDGYGAGGGSGFAAGPTGDRVLTRTASGLSFGQLATTAGRGQGGLNGMDTIGSRDLDTPVDVTNGPVWFSFLEESPDVSGDNQGYAQLNQNLGGDSNFEYRTGVVDDTAGNMSGVDDDPPLWGANDVPGYGGVYDAKPAPPQDNQTSFHLYKLTASGSDVNLDVWRYTDPSNFPTTAPTTGMVTDTSIYRGEVTAPRNGGLLENLGFNISDSDYQATGGDELAKEFDFDEVRLADSFADAAPVPEPASLALLGLGGLAMLGRRRRPADR